MREQEKIPKLSKRLLELTSLVGRGNRVCDVGCDHGFVSIYLVAKQISPHVLAMDVRTGPLSRAKEHIQEYHMEQQIETRLSDGLEAFCVGEAQSLILAGMGGPLMLKILESYPEKTGSFQELILQPQSEIPAFRKRIQELGYAIVEERMIYEDGKYYPMMKALPGQGDGAVYSLLSLQYGGILLQQRNEVLHQFLLQEKVMIEKLLGQLEKEAIGREDALSQWRHRYDLCKQALEAYR